MTNAEPALLPPAVCDVRDMANPQRRPSLGRTERRDRGTRGSRRLSSGRRRRSCLARGRPLVVVDRLVDAVAGNDVLVERFADDFLAVVAEGVDERGVDRADNRYEIDVSKPTTASWMRSNRYWNGSVVSAVRRASRRRSRRRGREFERSRTRTAAFGSVTWQVRVIGPRHCDGLSGRRQRLAVLTCD